MTTAEIGNRILTSLEELVGRLMDALRWEKPPAQASNLTRCIHDARRLRKQGDLDGVLTVLASADTSEATEVEARWLQSEWLRGCY